MNLPLMKQRSQCCMLLKEMKLAWKLTQTCKEGVLLECLHYLKENEYQKYLHGMNEATQIKIFQDFSLLQYILELRKNDVRNDRISALSEQVELEKAIASYEKAAVETVLKDPLVPSEYIRIYLDYYYHEDLEEERKKTLKTGLDHFYKKQSLLGESWIGQHGMLLLDDVISSHFLNEIKDYDRCLERYAASREYRQILSYIKGSMKNPVCLDDENAQELFEHGEEIQMLLNEMEQYFDESQMDIFCKLWLDNHALLYDMRHLKRKLEQSPGLDVESLLAGRASYVAFCYNEYFPEALGSRQEKLVIYAVTHKKHAFLKLIRENFSDFKQISPLSVLFQHSFYAGCINLNTLNAKNLKACAGLDYYSEEVLEILAAREHTFDEVALLYDLPIEYALLYEKISAARKDDRICIMREIVKKKCLNSDVVLDEAAAQLSKKKLSDWIQQDFKHIKALDADIAMRLLGEYGRLKQLIPQIRNIAEARYILNNIEKTACLSSMQEVRENAVSCNEEWNYLAEMFGFTEEFVKQNEDRVRDFIFTDGVHIITLFLRQNPNKKEELRRLVTAELMGKFRELKYHGSDLQKELDFPVTESHKRNWMKNRVETEGRLSVWEEDGFIPVMKMGEIPYRTCLSYIDGSYSQCLIANHDSNKKVLYLSLDGKIVLRAALRLTKGTYRDMKNPDDTPQLQFVDLAAGDNEQAESAQRQEDKEQLVLFLEREYVSELPESMHRTAFNLILSLLRKKAAELGALLVASCGYQKYASEEFISAHFSMYISKSKAGEQYLDSLGGSNHVNREGSYKRSRFLIDNN